MTRKRTCSGKVRYWALGMSVAVHAIALGVFTGVRLSTPVSVQASGRPVSMHVVQTAMEQPAVKPKPKVEPIAAIEPAPEVQSQPLPQTQPLVIEEKTAIEQPPPPVAAVEAAAPAVEPSPNGHEVEFFGQKSVVQRICYVVDCSGSMYGQMYRVKAQLKQSIMNLDTRQAFCVVFFMDGRQVLMTGSGRLETATVGAKSQALELIEKIKPAGSTDAAHAIECAMRLRDEDDGYPEIIYFLTDGFDLEYGGSNRFARNICGLRRTLAPTAVVHTIGFWPQQQDKQMLQTLAQNTGGEYIEVQ